jgi:hypothetical protein
MRGGVFSKNIWEGASERRNENIIVSGTLKNEDPKHIIKQILSICVCFSFVIILGLKFFCITFFKYFIQKSAVTTTTKASTKATTKKTTKTSTNKSTNQLTTTN